MRPARTHIMLCAGTGCVSNGAFKIKETLERELERHDLQNEVSVVMTGCNGFCAQGPVAVVRPDDIFYQFLKEDDIAHLVEEHFLKGRPVQRLMYTPPAEESPVPKMSDIGFFSKQRLIALRNRGMIDPEQIDESIARGGYTALAKALTEMTPTQIIGEIKRSGLRGRGGAGFPTGKKWELAANAKRLPKYLVCNADEGDPGAFMDRSIIESDPHSVLEGMIIGAKAIGASHGYVYIRNEYPLARQRLIKAIQQAKDYGLLGKDIFGTGFEFDISIQQGAGAFVCGEETSLIASLEGRAPEPKVRPPFPAESGVWDAPTNINNVETWANVPEIINKGAKWFASIGTETSKGTKVFSVVGKVKNTGLVEVPMGITLREIVFDIGGGIANDKKFKAVQTGGPSGGCIPESLLDLPIDYEKLAEVGSIMGSGGLIVMDEDTCMVDVARYFLEFLKDESCGKCTACREGVSVMCEILTRICAGDGREQDIDLLEELAQAVKDSSLCALGGTAPNPVLSTIRYFRDEYEAHIKYKRCPAGVCREIISAACQHTCPIEQDVPCYIGLIAHGKFEQAIEIVRRENPLPSICGRVCTAGCETKCRAGEGEGEAISIRLLKRFLADYERQKGLDLTPEPKQTRPEQVAIIGSGPAGLTCAYYLALEGYPVTVFESLPVLGGMLAVGIPDYRLPKDILDWEIGNIRKLGVQFKTNTTVGEDIQISYLQKQYKAIFIATGAHKGLKMHIEGEDLPQVIDAVDFLRALHLGQEVEIGQRVAVIGGGDAAIDAARVAKRLGKDVTILYRRTRREMPAAKEEIEGALEEGIEIQFLVAPVRVLSQNGQVTGIECVRMELGEVDRSGRRRPIPIEGSQFCMEIDTLMPAIGQQPDLSALASDDRLKTSKANTIEVNPETFCCGAEGIFAGGDAVSGPNAVTAAMAHGKIAAKMIHAYIQGQPLGREYKVTRPAMRVEALELTDKEIEELQKPSVPMLALAERSEGFKEVELGFTEEMAIREAKRCLRCDLELKEEGAAV